MTRLTDHPNADETPVWSPDGQRLAFISNRTGSYQVFLMDPDGSNLTQVTQDYDNSLPVWLPDGQSIAFRTTDNKGLWWWRKAKLDSSDIVNINVPVMISSIKPPPGRQMGKKSPICHC
jgi:Tol biopolymer transport system component